MDFLILRRLGELLAADPGETLVELWPLLPLVTIAELKTVPGPYEKGNLDRLWMYCHGDYAGNHKDLPSRDDLCALLIVPRRTPTLDADARAMQLEWVDLGHGDWRLLGGKCVMLAVEIDVVADQPDEDLVVSSSQSSRTIWQDFEVTAAPKAKGKRQEAKGKSPDPEPLPFALCLLPFALTAARRLCVRSTVRALGRLFYGSGLSPVGQASLQVQR